MVRAWVLLALGAMALGLSCAAMFATAASPAPYHAQGGGFVDFTPRGTQPLLQYPLRGNAECLTCHTSTYDSGDPDEFQSIPHYPGASWSGSMMANATRDPLFWAALDVANQDGIDAGAEGIGDYCLRCHTPNGWFNGRVRKTQDVGAVPAPGQIIDGVNGCRLQGNHENSDAAGNDYSGIGCQFCHRNLGEGPGGEANFLENADIWLDDTECDSDGDGNGDDEPCRQGPYAYPDIVSGFSGPPHAWKQSAHIVDSAMCGSCHDVTTPMLESGPFRTLILDDGTLAGNDTQLPYPVERTYTEWQRSDFGTLVFRDGVEDGGEAIPGKRLASGDTCQDCHMRQAQPRDVLPEEDLLVCSFGPPRNDNAPVHEFVGGNTWVPTILKGEFPGLDRGAAFDQTTAWANEMLSERSAQLATQATLAPGGGALAVNVTVTNLAGHKLPTGYAEGRRMWLEVQVRDGANALLWSNGDWNAATGDLAIDAQTKIYEIKQGIWNTATGDCDTKDAQDREMFHFVLNNCIAKDNRIPPLGFTGAADPELASYAYTYPPEAPGSARQVNFDRTAYTVPLPAGATGPFTVQARLQFQLSSKDYIEFLRNEAVENSIPAENALCAGGPGRPFSVGPQDKSRGQYVYDLWNSPAYGKSPPVEMATAQAVVAP